METYWITTERSNVSSYPVNPESLVFQREVLFFAISETEDVESVVDGDEDDGLIVSN